MNELSEAFHLHFVEVSPDLFLQHKLSLGTVHY